MNISQTINETFIFVVSLSPQQLGGGRVFGGWRGIIGKE
jgi:hypothetical protein